MLALGLCASLCTIPARADDKGEINAVLARTARAFNNGDQKAFASLSAAATQAVIDDIPPHYWNGRNAIANWFRAVDGANKA